MVAAFKRYGHDSTLWPPLSCHILIILAKDAARLSDIPIEWQGLAIKYGSFAGNKGGEGELGKELLVSKGFHRFMV